MDTQAYLLTFIIYLAGSDASTTRQMVTIAAATAEKAVELAQFYKAGFPTESVCSTTLTDASGAVVWSEKNGEHDVDDQP
jgi:hypothetical protein